MRKRKYTDEELIIAVKESYSVRSTLGKLNLALSGGNYKTIHDLIIKSNIDISHFTGMGHLKNKTHNYNTRKIEDILVYGKIEQTNRLRNRLLKEGLKQHICEVCQLREWNNRKIPLELHHINGDSKDNRIENLQLLCPNCHAQTDNYRGRNINKVY